MKPFREHRAHCRLALLLLLLSLGRRKTARRRRAPCALTACAAGRPLCEPCRGSVRGWWGGRPQNSLLIPGGARCLSV